MNQDPLSLFRVTQNESSEKSEHVIHHTLVLFPGNELDFTDHSPDNTLEFWLFGSTDALGDSKSRVSEKR